MKGSPLTRISEFNDGLRVERFELTASGVWHSHSTEFPFSHGWCGALEAKQILGSGFTRSVYAIQGEYLVYRRPLPAKVEFLKSSVLAFRDTLAANPSFWNDPAARAAWRDVVQQEARKLVESSLQSLSN